MVILLGCLAGLGWAAAFALYAVVCEQSDQLTELLLCKHE